MRRFTRSRAGGGENRLSTGRPIAPRRRDGRRAVARAADAVVESLEDRRLLAVSMVNGWTVVTLNTAVGDRAVYVSSSGTDAAGRGFTDTTPVKTLSYARGLIRDNTGDQLLLKRGDIWTGQNFGTWTKDGRSASEPVVIGTYGTGARPLVKTGASTAFNTEANGVAHIVIQGIQFYANSRDPANGTPNTTAVEGIRLPGLANDVTIEDVDISFYGTNISLGNFYGSNSDLVVRRSIVRDAYAIDPTHSNGLFVSVTNGVTVEENVFDHNGWHATVAGAGSTIFNHNVYVQVDSSNLVVRKNVFARGASHGLQARPGGIVEDNTFIDNAIGMSFGLVNGAHHPKTGGVTGTVARNTFLGGAAITEGPAAGDRGIGIQIGNILSADITDNVFAHYTAGTVKNVAIEVTIPDPDDNGYKGIGLNDLTFERNVVYDWNKGMYINPSYDPNPPDDNDHLDIVNFTFRNNDVQALATTEVLNIGSFNTTTEPFSNNQYGSAAGTPQARVSGVNQNLSTWIASNETGSSVGSVTYSDPNRSAGSYANTLGVGTTTTAYLNAAKQQSNGNWNDNRTGEALSDYVRGGFASGAAGTPAPPAAVRIDVANTGTYTDSAGRVWSADTGATGGNTLTSSYAVAGTTDDALYYTRRYNTAAPFSYALPINAGTYTLRLHFAESNTAIGVGQRVFDVSAEGTLIFDNLDIVAEVGSVQRALVKEKLINVTDGTVNLTFTNVVGDPVVSAIELVPTATFQQDNAGLVSMEAENRSNTVGQGGKTWTSVTTPTGYSGSSAMQALSNSGVLNEAAAALASSPRLDFSILFQQTGTHTVWVRALGANGSDDSIHIGLDGAIASAGQTINNITNSYNWRSVTVNVAAAGVHNLNVWMREDGVVVDKLVVAKSTTFTPTGTGPAETRWGTRIDVGNTGSYTDSNGYVWGPDTGATGGTVLDTTVSVAGTTDDELYHTRRYAPASSFSYAIGVENGTYRLRLHFAETNTSITTGQRVFDVQAEGSTVVDNLDIYSEVGSLRAYSREVTVTVTDGTFNLVFSPVVGDPVVSAFELLRV
jgi:hypothetical protein